jgi:tRNA pseudouridine38-40 synthase
MPTAPPPTAGVVRLRIDLGYDGTEFVGWAKQPGLRSVETELEDAIRTVCRLTEPPRVSAAGRTDAGVHARAQVVQVDLPADAMGISPAEIFIESLTYRLRGILPRDIVVRSVQFAPPGFDARFSALSRRYRYRVCDDPSELDPWRRHDTLEYPRPLDVDVLNAAARLFIGRHDFAAFCRKRPRATTIRTVLDAQWERARHRRTAEPTATIKLSITADAFCHSMVRSLVGGMLSVGDGRRDLTWLAEYLAGQVRGPDVMVAPARGLILDHVEYPPTDLLAERAALTRARRR